MSRPTLIHDIQLGYSFGEAGVKTKVYGGICNLFEKKPPFLPACRRRLRHGNDTQLL